MRVPTDSWPVLDRLNRSAIPPEAPTPTATATVAREPAVIAPRRAAVEVEAAPARRAGRSLLGRYADTPEPAAPTAEAARQMPLADVFARLELAGR
ncbi:hypothetical protein LJR219_000062 [Phenylobacterium sp. LjRoot219]|uniref:hypothetical protein n=1 Tax=Phenylobacterium sp. LjRoot219 TaxID=3342283 RepID=UPI003ECF7123